MVRSCSVASALEVVGERWSLLVIRELFMGVRRFNEIQANTGAPRDILTARLKSLQTAGIIEKRPYSEHPPRDEYHLAEAGKALFAVLTTMREWGEQFRPAENTPRFEHACGSSDGSRLVCVSCGEPMTARTLSVFEKAAIPATEKAPHAETPS